MYQPPGKRPLYLRVEIVWLTKHQKAILVKEEIESFEEGWVSLHAIYGQFHLQISHHFLLEEEVCHFTTRPVSGHQTLIAAFVQHL